MMSKKAKREIERIEKRLKEITEERKRLDYLIFKFEKGEGLI